MDCQACGSVDCSLDHRYWSCSRIRPLIIEAFSVLRRPPDLRAWIFGFGLEDDDLAILAYAKSIIYRYFVQVGLTGAHRLGKKAHSPGHIPRMIIYILVLFPFLIIPQRDKIVFEWHSRFKAGRISIEDDLRQGRPKIQRTDENVQKITDLIKENPRTTLLELEQDTGISKTTIGRIVTKSKRLLQNSSQDSSLMSKNCVGLQPIITGYETWVYGYDPETKHQSAEWRCQGELRPKKSRLLKSRNKVLLVAFLDKKGIFHHEYIPAGQTVIKDMYLGILRRLREAIRKKRPEKWTNGGWILHHDNARPHTAHLMTSFLAKNGTQILLQPPYFPDIAPNDFFLFPKLEAVLKGRHFDTRDDIIEKSPLALKSIPKEAYKNCFDNWEKRWRWCVEARGDYFEKF
ncbi:hypothetical protein LAZ67_14000549 [Cordylochernes scorpioides]|uniref:Transposase n=1 Tax=Cordylochernes scorpioides TaxID=51811 RepID=A0ABY6L6J4_9ARAC|nr:hypothetical protein LAZ67_14000549 [Cordylochernes scorpioides]